VGGAQKDVTPYLSIARNSPSASNRPGVSHCITAAPTIICPKSFPHAAFAQPVSETVQCRSFSVNPCANFAVTS